MQLAEPIFAMIDNYFGVPPIFRNPPLLCGLSTPSERSAHATNVKHKMEMAKIDIREIWSELRMMSQEERITYAIGEWRKLIVPYMRAYSGNYHHDGWMDQILEPLIRFGKAAIPLLRAQQTQESELDAKSLWECVIAAIEGSANEEIVRALLPRHPDMACEIIAASGSKKWEAELEQLVVSIHLRKALEALAACHHEECRLILERLTEAEGNETTADYLLKEFELRSKRSALPRLTF